MPPSSPPSCGAALSTSRRWTVRPRRPWCGRRSTASRRSAGLAFDLAARTLVVWHAGEPALVLGRLAPLALGARLADSRRGRAARGRRGAEARRPRRPRSGSCSRSTPRCSWSRSVAGWLAESTGLLADGADMLADATVYALALYAVGRAPALKLRAARVCGALQLLLGTTALAEVIRRAAGRQRAGSRRR